MEERWATISDLPNYEVSDMGRIRNVKTGRNIKTHINKKGYETVCLYECGKPYTKKVHRLVAGTFSDEDIHGMDVAHKDKNRQNNRFDNLVIRTRREIVSDTYLNGRKQIHKMRAVKCVETGEIFESITACSEAMGIGKQAISRCLNNPYLRTSQGLHFVAVDS